MKPIRLACRDCDTESHDGTTLQAARADSWVDIIADPDDGSLGHWWTHTGQCAECARAEREHQAELNTTADAPLFRGTGA